LAVPLADAFISSGVNSAPFSSARRIVCCLSARLVPIVDDQPDNQRDRAEKNYRDEDVF
jgi:hypothetical protein